MQQLLIFLLMWVFALFSVPSERARKYLTPVPLLDFETSRHAPCGPPRRKFAKTGQGSGRRRKGREQVQSLSPGLAAHRFLRLMVDASYSMAYTSSLMAAGKMHPPTTTTTTRALDDDQRFDAACFRDACRAPYACVQ
jgi:hypothetical protein